MALGVWVPRQGVPVLAGDAAVQPGAVGVGDPGVVPWPVQLTTHAGLDRHPSLSPHGDAVAFASDRSGGFEIYVRALQGTATETALTSNGGQNVQPAWSRDGRFLAYHSQRFGGIWVVPARGGTPKQIAPAGSNPSWSPDSQRIAFQSDEHVDVAPEGFVAQAAASRAN
jgi:Tol biopolymer transport system component